MGYLKCEKCGGYYELQEGESPDDFEACECGGQLKYTESLDQHINKDEDQTPERTGMLRSTKLLITVVVLLVAVLGVTVGVLWQMNNVSPSNSPVAVNQTQSDTNQQPVQASWHEITTITNPTDGLVSFNIKGDKCKIVISATPVANYQINILSVDLLKENSAVGMSYLSWTETELPKPKENSTVVSTGPGTYQVNIYPTNLDTWSIKVYDYY